MGKYEIQVTINRLENEIRSLQTEIQSYHRMNAQISDTINKLTSARNYAYNSYTSLQKNYQSNTSTNKVNEFKGEYENINRIIMNLQSVILSASNNEINKINNNIQNKENEIQKLRQELAEIERREAEERRRAEEEARRRAEEQRRAQEEAERQAREKMEELK